MRGDCCRASLSIRAVPPSVVPFTHNFEIVNDSRKSQQDKIRIKRWRSQAVLRNIIDFFRDLTDDQTRMKGASMVELMKSLSVVELLGIGCAVIVIIQLGCICSYASSISGMLWDIRNELKKVKCEYTPRASNTNYDYP